MLYVRGGQPAAHCSWGKYSNEKLLQLISSYIRGGQPMADCTLISGDDLFLENRLVLLLNFEVFGLCGGYELGLNKIDGLGKKVGHP